MDGDVERVSPPRRVRSRHRAGRAVGRRRMCRSDAGSALACVVEMVRLRLYLCERTSNVMKKLNVKGRSQAVVELVRLGELVI